MVLEQDLDFREGVAGDGGGEDALDGGVGGCGGEGSEVVVYVADGGAPL